MIIKLSEEIKLRGFSSRTNQAYVYNVGKFLQWIKESSKKWSSEHVREYILYLHDKNYDSSTIRQIKASLLFFFETVLGEQISIKLTPLKKKKRLPKHISKQEIKKLLSNIKNKKHKLMIKILYSSGLRVSELINLKRSDLDCNNDVILVDQGKGKKDRMTILSEKIKNEILDYICKTEFNSPYLFEGRKGKYSVKTIQKILENSSQNLSKKVTPHMLRHSFATHLLENGVNIKYIQKLLGHSRLETTNIYTYVAKLDYLKIKSPFDHS